MRIATILIAIPLFSVAAGTGRVERCNFDLRAPSRQIALHATEGLDTAVEASIRSDGTIPDLSGWRLMLWYGDAATKLGVAFTNISLSRGVARWDIPGEQIATNGRFTVQIVGQHTSGRSEEWARGWLAIDRNSASSFSAMTFGTPGWALATNVQAIVDAEAQARAAGDTVAMTNWQARVDALTNGAARGATALQPPATNTLAAAAAHAATAHGVTEYGGFQGGVDAYTMNGGAVGYGAQTMDGGAVGAYAHTTDGGAVGSGAYTIGGGAVGSGAYTIGGGAVGENAYTENGGAVGTSAQTMDGGAVGAYAHTTDGGAVGLHAVTSDGFAGGKDAFATTDGNWGSPGIDAIQLGTGGNSEPGTLQIYGNRLLNADGTIPVARLAATLNASNAADRAYADAAVNAANLVTRAMIGPTNGCTELTGTTPVVSGVTKNYFLLATNDYTLSVDSSASRAEYTVEIFSEGAVHSCTLSGIELIGSWTVTGTNVVVLVPSTGTVWHAYGRGL